MHLDVAVESPRAMMIRMRAAFGGPTDGVPSAPATSPREAPRALRRIVVVICCGLGSRSELLALPPFFAKYAGDALWALMIFLGFGFLLPVRSTAAVAGLAVAVCGTIECSQLYHAPWLDAVRRTWFGRVALGDTFGW